MNMLSVAIGAAAILYGIYTAWARAAKPEQFRKLAAMRKSFGHTGGTVVHFIAYTLVPLGVGVTFLLAGLQGKSVF